MAGPLKKSLSEPSTTIFIVSFVPYTAYSVALIINDFVRDSPGNVDITGGVIVIFPEDTNLIVKF